MKIVDTLPSGEKASFIDLGQKKALAVFEADTQEELRTVKVGHEAIAYANAGGLVGAAIRDEGSVYAVDADGNICNPMAGIPTGAKFRVEIKLGSTL